MKLKRMAGAAAVLLLLAVCTGALAVDTGIITAEGVNLRESPDKESNALGTLELGSEVEVLAVENGWYRIMLKSGTVGYIRQDYIFFKFFRQPRRVCIGRRHIYTRRPQRGYLRCKAVNSRQGRAHKGGVWRVVLCGCR